MRVLLFLLALELAVLRNLQRDFRFDRPSRHWECVMTSAQSEKLRAALNREWLNE
jgi:hypothetical protein